MKVMAKAILVLVFLSPLLLFQNCGDGVRLVAPTKPGAIEEKINGSVHGSICPQPPITMEAPRYTFFMVDMSASNVDDEATTTGNDGSDPNGQRLMAIKNYIDRCATNPDNRFAVLGFSDSLMPTFAGLTDAAGAINNLRVLWSKQFDSPLGVPSSKVSYDNVMDRGMTGTRYVQAFGGIASAVASLSQEDPDKLRRSVVRIFFVTDGVPGDVDQFTDVVLPSAQRSYLAIKSMTTNSSFQVLAYGNSSAFGQYLTPLARVTGADTYLNVQNGNVDYCNLASNPIQTSYQLSHRLAVNLTAILRNGQLVPDSDADGIPDSEDQLPFERRSPSGAIGILDKSNHKPGGGGQNCSAADISNWLGLGLTKCDFVKKGLDLSKLDYDNDLMFDLYEILRGGNVFAYDSDQEYDQLRNIQKMERGRMLNTTEGTVAGDRELRVSYKTVSDDVCGTDQRWAISFDNLPLVRTLAVHLEGPNTTPQEQDWINHEAGENLILMIYGMKPMSSDSLPELFFAFPKPLRVKAGSTETLVIDPNSSFVPIQLPLGAQ